MQKKEKLLEAAVDAAHAAGKVIRKHFAGKLKIREKSDNMGLVTNADVEAEAAAIRVLKKAQPDFSLLTEETHSQGRIDGRQGLWILDPLDGTTNFVHRFPMFCVTIAAQIANDVEVAVTYHPILDDLYTAIRGKGAFLNGKRMRVSDRKKISDALLSTGFSYHRRNLLSTEMTSFEKLSMSARAIRRPGSAALDLAYTACGVFDGFWERHLAPWDVAAGSLLVSEAGGKVSDFDGKKLNIYGPEILATNGKIHRQLLKNI